MSLKCFMKSSSTRNQYFAAFVVNLISLSHGCCLGWLSPFLPYLRSDETHLETGPVNSENVSWIGSLLAVGGITGAIVFGKISNRFGLKIALIFLVIPHFVFWILVLSSTHVYHLYLARYLAGITGGGAMRTISLFIAEISENNIRGRLGSLFMLFLSSGTLLIFVAGTYISFFVVPFVMMTIPVIYFVLVLFLHDSPASLMTRKKENAAWDSLLFYRTCGENRKACEKIKEEFELLKTSLSHKHEAVKFDDFMTKPAKIGLATGLFLMFLNQFSGTFAIMTYTADIFKTSGSDLSPNESSIIVAVVQLFGIYTSTIFVERFGRKILMTISTIGSSFSLLVLSAYLYVKHSSYDVSHLNSLPILSLSFYIFLASLGIISLPFVIMTELLPNKIRHPASTICIIFITFLAFIVLKIFPIMIKIFELHGCIFFFAGVCLIGAFITICFIPETKGKSLILPNETDKESREMLDREQKKVQIVSV